MTVFQKALKVNSRCRQNGSDMLPTQGLRGSDVQERKLKELLQWQEKHHCDALLGRGFLLSELRAFCTLHGLLEFLTFSPRCFFWDVGSAVSNLKPWPIQCETVNRP